MRDVEARPVDPDELTTITVEDDVTGAIEVTGYLIGRIDTSMGAPGTIISRPRPRWSVNQVIKLRSGKYVLIMEAFSLFYHRADSNCRTQANAPKGELATAADLEPDARPCFDCEPPWPRGLRPDDPVRIEVPKTQVVQCDTPAQVAQKLMRRNRGGVITYEMSEPARALIEQCLDNDPDFENVTRSVVSIG